MAHSNDWSLQQRCAQEAFQGPHSGATLTVRRELALYSRVCGGTRYARAVTARKRRRLVVQAVVFVVLGVLAVGLAVASARVVGLYGSIGSRLNGGVTAETKAVLAEQQASAQLIAADWTDTSPFYMLLLGVDANESRMTGGESADYGPDSSAFRSDTMILARVDPGEKKVTLVSIHRDTRVPIGGKMDKINVAYPLGGAAGAIEAVSDFAGVPISHYAEIDLDGLYAVVDALGGVEVNVPYAVNDSHTGWTLEAGPQLLDGEGAEVFVRSRHAYDDLGDGDRYRAANQRLFIAAVLQRLMVASPADMVAAIDTLADYVKTDLTLDQVAGLALAMRGIDVESDIYSTMNPTEPALIDGLWYEISQDEYWHEIMQQVDAGERPDVDYAYVSVTDDINSAGHWVDGGALGNGTSVSADSTSESR